VQKRSPLGESKTLKDFREWMRANYSQQGEV